MFYDVVVSIFECIRKNDNTLYIKYYKDIVKFYNYLYSLDNTRARIPVLLKINIEVEFIDIAQVLRYDKIDELGYYLMNNPSISVLGSNYHDATFGSSNLVKFRTVGPTSQVYEINVPTAVALWPSEVSAKMFDIEFNKKYNYSGGVYVLLTDNVTMNNNFPEYTNYQV